MDELQNYQNDILVDDILLLIFSYLHGGVILRCGAVCKTWKLVCDDGYLWLKILGVELSFEPGLNFTDNVEVNKELVRQWSTEKNTSPKQIYLLTRRKEKINNKFRVFPRFTFSK